MKDILQTLAAEGSFQILLSMLEEAELAETLVKEGPFTLFAPNDDAFGRMNIDEIRRTREKLASILTYHVVDGKYTADRIAGEESVVTSSGKSLTVHRHGGVQTIDNANYVKTDMECSNGVIHVINNVFLPQLSGWYCGGCC